MYSKELLTAIIKDKKTPERMGIYEHFWPYVLNGSWLEQGYPSGSNPVDHFDLDLQAVGGWINTEPLFQKEENILEENDETKIVKNGWGTVLRLWKKKSGTPEHISFELTDSSIWKNKFREPLLCFNPDRIVNIQEQKDKFKKYANSSKFIVLGGLFLFEIMRASMGDVTMLEAMLLDRPWIDDFSSVVTDFMIRHYDYLFREVGIPDGFFMYEDLGYTRAPFISPEMHRDIILPWHKKFIGFIKSYGIPVIMHTCGNIVPHIPAIIESGVDCLQPMEAKTGMNVVELGQTFAGKLSFMGNMDIRAFETNDKEAIRAEILPKLTGIRKHKIPYIMHSDHSISPMVTYESYKYAVSLFRENSHY